METLVLDRCERETARCLRLCALTVNFTPHRLRFTKATKERKVRQHCQTQCQNNDSVPLLCTETHWTVQAPNVTPGTDNPEEPITEGNFWGCSKLYAWDWLFFLRYVLFLELRLLLKLCHLQKKKPKKKTRNAW